MASSRLDMSNWTVNHQGMTLAEAFGVTKGNVQLPTLSPKLALAQSQAGGSSSSGSSGNSGGGGSSGSSGSGSKSSSSAPRSGSSGTTTPKPKAASSPTVNTGSGGSTSSNRALGQQMAAAAGWTGSEWTDFNNVVEAESGWNAYAANPTSDARGIAQKISGWSSNYQPGNAREQIAWMISYIKSRYGTPAAAWAHERAYHWY